MLAVSRLGATASPRGSRRPPKSVMETVRALLSTDPSTVPAASDVNVVVLDAPKLSLSSLSALTDVLQLNHLCGLKTVNVTRKEDAHGNKWNQDSQAHLHLTWKMEVLFFIKGLVRFESKKTLRWISEI